MKKLLALNLTPFAVMLFGVIAIVVGIKEHARWGRIDAGIVSPGSVVDAKTEPAKRGRVHYFFEVSLSDTPGTSLFQWYLGSKARYRAQVQDNFGGARITERAVEVKYNPEKPREGQVVGEDANLKDAVQKGIGQTLVATFRGR